MKIKFEHNIVAVLQKNGMFTKSPDMHAFRGDSIFSRGLKGKDSLLQEKENYPRDKYARVHN